MLCLCPTVSGWKRFGISQTHCRNQPAWSIPTAKLCYCLVLKHAKCANLLSLMVPSLLLSEASLKVKAWLVLAAQLGCCCYSRETSHAQPIVVVTRQRWLCALLWCPLVAVVVSKLWPWHLKPHLLEPPCHEVSWGCPFHTLHTLVVPTCPNNCAMSLLWWFGSKQGNTCQRTVSFQTASCELGLNQC